MSLLYLGDGVDGAESPDFGGMLVFLRHLVLESSQIL